MRDNIKYILLVLVVLFSSGGYLQAQKTTTQSVLVEGFVVDEANVPVEGVKVSVQEKTISETTDINGHFALMLHPNDVLVINEKGFYPITRSVTGETSIKLILTRYKSGEEDKVTVAFGEQNRRNSTGAIASVSTINIDKNSVTNIEQAMEGTLPGLYSIRNSGEKFGRSNINLFVRGKATLANASPLILLDGMEFNSELLDYKEVESITVLKDAVSLAMYGMRGANGVILINTKAGSELKSGINFNIRSGVQQAEHITDRLNAYQYTTLYNEALMNDGAQLMFDPSVYQNPTVDPYLHPDEDMKSMFLGSISPYQHYNFSASGGNNITRYFVLASYLQQEGIFKEADYNNSYNRFNFRSNIDVNLFKGFVMNVLLSASIDKNKSPFIASTTTRDIINSTFNSIMTTPANAFPVFNRDGSLGGTTEYQVNPYGILNKSGTREDETRMLNALIKGRYDLSTLLTGLSADAFYGFENYNMQYSSVYHKFAVYQEQSDGSYTQFGVEDNKNAREAGLLGGFYRYTTFGGALNYDKNFNEDHELSGKLQYYHSVRTIPGDNPDNKYQALALRTHYGFKKKYYAELAAAYQGSTNYQLGERNGLFPALGLSWIVSEEGFLKKSSFVNFLKVRSSLGLNGNDQTGSQRFAHRHVFSSAGGYGFGSPNGASDGSREGALPYFGNTWEKAFKANIGFDLELMNSVNLSLDYFNEQRDDILVVAANQIPSLIGIPVINYNAGRISNQGVDGSIVYNKRFSKGGFSVGGNFVYAKNKIIDIKEMQYAYAHQFRKGNSIDTRFGYQTNGLYVNEDQLSNAPGASFGVPELGSIIYQNQNSNDDNIIDDRDRVALGNSFPELIYGASLAADYRGFDIHCNMRGSELFSTHFIPGKISQYSYENRWDPNAPTVETNYPRLSINSDYNQQTSDFWERKAHLFRVTAIEFGYTFQESLMRKISLSSARLYVNANNPFTYFNKTMENRDPEASSAGFSQYPMLKTFSLGLSVNL